MRNLISLSSVGLLLIAAACGDSGPDNLSGIPGVCGGEGGTDATIEGGPGDAGVDAPPGCDLTKEPKDSTACVADSVGVFVSTTGDDNNPGTKAKPVKTIAAGLGKLNGLTRLYVCAGTYPEDVVLDSSHDGTSIYGGWKCSDWSYDAVGVPTIGKGTLALKVDGLSKPIVLSDIAFTSADATTPGSSSIAALINMSSGVNLTRAKLTAGKGKAGATSMLVPFTYPDPATKLAGNAASGNSGGPQNQVTCPAGDTTTGGQGGDGTNKDGAPGMPSLGGGAGGTALACFMNNTNGSNGAAATAAGPGPGATTLGTITSTGWTSTDGKAGPNGTPGQGGGGGGGPGGGGGGGGGAGGCGGAGGPPGKGGGSSFALVSLNSNATVVKSTLVAQDAGDSSAGLAGQLGQSVGGAHGASSGLGCQGGNGAAGGNGGAGGGGSGGLSIALIYKGTLPVLDTSTSSASTFGTKGKKGTGGVPGTNDGIDGIAQAIYECKGPLCN